MPQSPNVINQLEKVELSIEGDLKQDMKQEDEADASWKKMKRRPLRPFWQGYGEALWVFQLKVSDLFT